MFKAVPADSRDMTFPESEVIELIDDTDNYNHEVRLVRRGSYRDILDDIRETPFSLTIEDARYSPGIYCTASEWRLIAETMLSMLPPDSH